jgi:hypothetical protein
MADFTARDVNGAKSAGLAPSEAHAAASDPGSVWDVVAHYRAHRDGGGRSARLLHLAKGQSSSGSGAAVAAEAHAAAIQCFRDFMRLCVCFGLAQGAIITTVTYATTLMGESVGSYCDGCFFGAFTLTSFCLAEALVAAVGGPLNAYRTAVALFLAYVIALATGHHLHANAVLAALHGSGDGTSGAARVVAYAGSVVGGLGFSLHWTGQSVLYRLAANRYAHARSIDASTVNGTFSGLFAAVYVPFEMACKQAASVLLMALPALPTFSDDDEAAAASSGGSGVPWYRAKDSPWPLRATTSLAVRHFADSAAAELTVVAAATDAQAVDDATIDARVWGHFFVLFSAILCLSAALVPHSMGLNFGGEAFSEDDGGEASSLLGGGGGDNFSGRGKLSIGGKGTKMPDGEGDSDGTVCERTLRKVLDTPRMLWENPVLMALMPINVSFGVTAGFFFTYFYDKTVALHQGSAAVGLVAALGSAIVALSAVPLSILAVGIGKGPVVVLGSACFGAIGVAYLVVPGNALGSWGGVFLINTLMGVGRAVWENTNKAIYADLFTAEESPAAFANMYMVTGLLTFLSLFLFPSLPLPTMAVLVVLPALAMGPGYYRAVNLAATGYRFRESRFKRACAAAALAAASGSKTGSSICSGVGGGADADYGSAVVTL